MIDRLDGATRPSVWFSIKQHQTFCFRSIASPTNTINQFAGEFVAIAERGGDIAFSVTSSNVLFCVISFKGDFVCTRFVSRDPRRRVEGAPFIPLVPCVHVYRWTRVWKGLNIFFGGLAPLFGLPLPPWGFVHVVEVSIRNFMAVKGSRLERNIEDRC